MPRKCPFRPTRTRQRSLSRDCHLTTSVVTTTIVAGTVPVNRRQSSAGGDEGGADQGDRRRRTAAIADDHALVQDDRREHHRHDRVERGKYRDDAEISPASWRPRRACSRRRRRGRPSRAPGSGRSTRAQRCADDERRHEREQQRDAASRRNGIRDARVGGPVREDEVERRTPSAAVSARPNPSGAAAALLVPGSREATSDADERQQDARAPGARSAARRTRSRPRTGSRRTTAEIGATIPIAPTAIPR